MRIEQTILTSEPVDIARSLAIAYLERRGYQVKEDSGEIVILERGSKLGTYTGFKTTQWHTQANLQFAPGPGQSTQIAAVFDIDTTGQMVVNKERQQFAVELEGLVQSVNGQTPLGSKKPEALNPVSNYERSMRGGASWFYWIAGMSVLNSVLWRLGSELTFIIGLNITQVVDGLTMGLADRTPELTTPLTIAAFVVNLVVAGFFVLLGVFAYKKRRWAFITGIVLYVLDGLIFLLAFDLASLFFHLIALYGLVRGLLALNQMRKAEMPLQASVHLPA